MKANLHGPISSKHIFCGSKLGRAHPNNNCFGVYLVILGSKSDFTFRVDYTTSKSKCMFPKVVPNSAFLADNIGNKLGL